MVSQYHHRLTSWTAKSHSSLGGFQTPAAVGVGMFVKAGVWKPSHKRASAPTLFLSELLCQFGGRLFAGFDHIDRTAILTCVRG